MRKALILRNESSEQGTQGLLITDTGKRWFTLELPWLNNKQGKSSIPLKQMPAGIYKVLWTLSPRLKKYTYEIIDVEGRGGIRMHSGNFAGSTPKYKTHSLGCPLLGTRIGLMNNQLAIFGSKIAVMQFEKEMNKQSFLLEIKNA